MHFDTFFCFCFQYCFLIWECLTQQLLKVSFKHNFLNILKGWKNKSHCTKRGLKILWILIIRIPIRNRIRKVRLGVKIFDKRNLILVSSIWTQCFRIQPHLQQSFPCSRQSINRYHSASGIYFLCFHFPCFWQEGGGPSFSSFHFPCFWQEGGGPSFSTLLFSFFLSRVYSHVLFHTGFCSWIYNKMDIS